MQMCNRSIVSLKDFLAAIVDILILKSNRVLMMNQVKCQQQARWRWSYEDGHIENVQEIKWFCLPMPTNIPPSGEDVMISLFIISFIFNMRTPNCVLLEKASANDGWWSISRHMHKSIQDRHCWWWHMRNIAGGKKREPDSQLRLILKLKLPSRSLHTPTIALMICMLFTSRGSSSEEEEQAPK